MTSFSLCEWTVLLVSCLRTVCLARGLKDFLLLFIFLQFVQVFILFFLDLYLSISFLFDALVNGIVFYFCFHMFLLIRRHVVDFRVSIWYSATLLSSLFLGVW